MVFGYACNETDAFMPLPIHLSHALTMQLSKVRKSAILPYLGPDGKSQVTVEYKNGIPVRVDAVVISSQHLPDIPQEVIREDIYYNVIESLIPDHLLDAETKVFINPTGRFVLGGPETSGRVIAVYDGRMKGGTVMTLRFAHIYKREIRI